MRIIKSKKKRLEVIKEIISNQKIDSQLGLLTPLREAGIEVTQATLSRDLKQLKIAKVPDSSGRYIYTLPQRETLSRNRQIRNLKSPKLETADIGGFISIDFSYNLAVIKTSPGFAGSIAYDIDTDSNPDILGTVAGDDTIIVVFAEGVSQDQAYDMLSQHIPALCAY